MNLAVRAHNITRRPRNPAQKGMVVSPAARFAFQVNGTFMTDLSPLLSCARDADGIRDELPSMYFEDLIIPGISLSIVFANGILIVC